jgi:hypothetical protein
MTGKWRFNFGLLQSICLEGGVTLLVDYSNVRLTRDSRIKAKCIHCENSFDKSFNELDRARNFNCKDCSKTLKFVKLKNTMLTKYGVEYAAQSEEFKNKMKTTNLKKYGYECAIQNAAVQEKKKKTNLEKYGYEHGLQNKDVQEKVKKTNLEKYGVENCNQRKEVRDKTNQTNLEKYGTIFITQNEQIKEKIKQTNLGKYGTEYAFQSEDVKAKIKKTCLEKYGVEYNTQSDVVKNKSKLTCLDKYGVEHATQCSEIMEKMTKCMYKSKEYIMPSGYIVSYQGYENHAVDELLQNEHIGESDIIMGCKNVPTIWYEDKMGKKHRHFVDIFIPSQNRCIEVKSTWTAKINNDVIFLKQNAAKQLGYNYEIWIYDREKQKVAVHV